MSKTIISLSVVAGCLIGFAAVLITSYVVIGQNHQFSYATTESLANETSARTAVVLGTAVTKDREPRPVLQERLDAAVELYESDQVERFVVTGYTDGDLYNEPIAMFNYLTAQGIPAAAIIQDDQGTDTKMSCDNIADMGIDEAIIVTQPSHLDRAIYLCRDAGITAYGYPADTIGTTSYQRSQSARESLSNVKALFETKVVK